MTVNPTTLPRLYVDAAFAAGGRIELGPAPARYLGAVLRTRVGQCVRLFNGRDGEWLAAVAAIGRQAMSLDLQAPLRPQMVEPDLWLLFAQLKREASELVVQKATELGAAALLPLLTARTQAGRLNPARLAAIATEAAEQCERLTLPRIEPARSLAEALATWPDGRPLFAAIERLPAPPLAAATGPAALLIGPEGGFAPAELDMLQCHPLVRPISLGPRILRAETAAIAGLALLQAAPAA